LHGYGVLLRIQQISGEELVIQQGRFTLRFTGLSTRARFERVGESENNRRAKYTS